MRRKEGRSSKLHYTRAYLAADSTDWPNGQDPTDQSTTSPIYFRRNGVVVPPSTIDAAAMRSSSRARCVVRKDSVQRSGFSSVATALRLFFSLMS